MFKISALDSYKASVVLEDVSEIKVVTLELSDGHQTAVSGLAQIKYGRGND